MSTKYSCDKCQDTGEYEARVWHTYKRGEFRTENVICEECCEHGEYDHGICGYCDADCTDNLTGQAEDAFEGER